MNEIILWAFLILSAIIAVVSGLGHLHAEILENTAIRDHSCIDASRMRRLKSRFATTGQICVIVFLISAIILMVIK